MEETIKSGLQPGIDTKVTITQRCISCGSSYGNIMLQSCTKCKSKLEYVYEGNYKPKQNSPQNNIWKNFDLLPLNYSENIVTLGEGDSEIIELEELSHLVNGARIFMMMDSEKNPTGIFKDREASIILSRCKELQLDNLVFYSTANTGRSYTHYAAHLGLTTFLFMPKQCHYKNTTHIKKNRNNFIIYVDDSYPQIAPFAKQFAEQNKLNLIAPIHDRNESYSTIAYEQFEKLPKCDYFVQTIASGMGPIGFIKGHKNLIKLGLQRKEDVPRVICVQSSQMNSMTTAFNQGKTFLSSDALPKFFASDLYEPTLNSTNPVNNFPDLYDCLKESNGLITDVDPSYVELHSEAIVLALKKRGMPLRIDLEKSILIEFAGLIKLAKEQTFTKGEIILMLACGRGKDKSKSLYQPDAVISPASVSVTELKQSLELIL